MESEIFHPASFYERKSLKMRIILMGSLLAGGKSSRGNM